MILFDAARHEYTDSETGEVIRSVTQWLNASSPFYTADGRDRGRAVHELAERYAQGIRADNTGRLLESLEYLNSLASWFSDKKPYAVRTECMVEGAIGPSRYAGTFDLLCEIGGKLWLVDYKTGARQNWHKVQLAAYSIAHIASTGEAVSPAGCMALYLTKGGKYREDRLTPAEHLAAIRDFERLLDANC